MNQLSIDFTQKCPNLSLNARNRAELNCPFLGLPKTGGWEYGSQREVKLEEVLLYKSVKPSRKTTVQTTRTFKFFICHVKVFMLIIN